VPQGGEGSHPFPLIAISYEFPVHCHGRGRGFEPRRPRHKPEEKKRFMASGKIKILL
jgi:hypothetical protein